MDYRARWYNFVSENVDANFYVSTYPQFTSDIIFKSSQRLKMLIDRNLQPATREYEIGKKAIYSYHKKNIPGKSIRADALMTPLLYGYNATDERVKTCIGDMPMLVQRERFANSLRID